MRFPVLLAAFLVTGAAHAKTIEIKMKNNGNEGMMVFEPGFVNASPGDTVVFTPTDTSHNSTAVLVPEGAKAWTGKSDQKVSVKLDKEGVYIFKCDPHMPMAMVGVVQVGKAKNLDAAKAEAGKLAAGFAMNKDRLAKYLEKVK